MLEPIIKGLVEWLYELMVDIMGYASGELLGVMSMDLSYFESTAPIITDIVDVFIALGWALLIGNLVFQSLKAMISGAGFEAEDPKILFLRTFFFAFLLLASRQICDMCSAIAGTVIDLLALPDAIEVTTPDESMFSLGSGAKWLLVIIVGVVLMVQMVKLLFEIGERYVITSVLTFFAPLAFAMGGSKNTNDIFKGWCRMYGSMLVMMIMNIVFLKLIMSAMSQMAAGGVLVWLVFVVALTRVARKIDSHIGKLGLNPAQTGNELGSRIPGVMTMVAVRTMGSLVSRSMANAKGSSGQGHNGRDRNPNMGGGYRNNNSYNSHNTSSGYSTNTTNTANAVSTNVNSGNTVNRGGSTTVGGNTVSGGNVQNGGVRNNTNMDTVQNAKTAPITPRPGNIGTPSVNRGNGSVVNQGTNTSTNIRNTQQGKTVTGQNNPMAPRPNVTGVPPATRQSGGVVNQGANTTANTQTIQQGKQVTESNASATPRPPIPRNTSGMHPSGHNEMSSILNNSKPVQNNTTVPNNTGSSNGTNPPSASGDIRNAGGITSPSNPAMRPPVLHSSGGHSINNSIRNNGGDKTTDTDVVNNRTDVKGSTSKGINVMGGSVNAPQTGVSNTNVRNGGVNVGGNTHTTSDHTSSEHFADRDMERINDRQSREYAKLQAQTERIEKRVNHEYKHGRYNPAAANKKGKKMYYQKENILESRHGKQPRKRGDGYRKQRKK